MPTLQYPNNPNTDTAFVVQDDGTKNRALMTAPQDTSTIELPSNPNSTKGYIIVNGKKQRVVLTADITGGGGDQHNLGWYATESALTTAYPTAEAGDWAIVGATDTVWVWDTDNSEWVDSDQKGQVTSVNNQTGDVTVQETLVSGTNIKTIDGNSVLGSGNLELSTYLTFPSGWTTNGTTKAFCDDVAADTSAVEGKAYLGEVTFSDLPASMANGEIIVEIMDGTTAQNKVIVLTLTSGNTAPYMWKYTYWNNGSNVSGWIGFQEQLVSGTNIKTINSASLLGSGDLTIDSLPSQTGNSGKFLTTNGTSASWDTSVKQLRIKASSTIYCDFFVVSPTGGGTGIYFNSGSGQNVQLGGNFVGGLSFISKLYVREIYYGSHNSQGITVPAVGGTLALQIATMPTAGSTYKGTIYQFTGTTDSTYTNGHFYKCVSDGQTPATYSWEEISMGGGGSSSTTVTLAVNDWSSNAQTVSCQGVTSSNIIIVAPAPSSNSAYVNAGILCTAQGNGTLTFTCTSTPSSALTVNVVILS